MLELYANVIVNGLLVGAVYALMATGLNVIFGVMRLVNFAHGEMVVVGMYIGWVFWKTTGLSPLWALPLAALVLFALGYAFQRWLANAFVSRPQHAQFILFIALALALTGITAMMFGPDPRGVQSEASFVVYNAFGLRFDGVRTHAAVAAVLLMIVLWLWLRFTLTGKALHAAAENQIGGQAIGIRIPHLFAITAGIGCACAGAAGALIAPVFDTQPYMAADFTLLAFIIVIVGGLASLPGALVGGLAIGVAEALAAALIAPSAKALFSYGLLIIILLVRPWGLLGTPGRAH